MAGSGDNLLLLRSEGSAGHASLHHGAEEAVKPVNVYQVLRTEAGTESAYRKSF